MRPEQFIIGIALFLGSLGIIGTLIVGSTLNYSEAEVSDEFSEMMTGSNYSEYRDRVENLQETASSTTGEDGFLAQFKVANAVFSLVGASTSQAGAIITNVGDNLGIPSEVVVLFLTIVIISAIFGGIYLLVK